MIILPSQPAFKTRATMHDVVINDLAGTIPFPTHSWDFTTLKSCDGTQVYDLVTGQHYTANNSPVFTGTPGSQSKDTYLLGDGFNARYYEADTNSTALNSMHKAGATISIAAWVYVSTAATAFIPLMTTRSIAADVGFNLYYNGPNGAGALAWNVSNGTGTPFRDGNFGSTTPIANSWQFIGYSHVLPAGGTGAYTANVHCSARQQDSISVTPTSGTLSTADSTYKHRIGTDNDTGGAYFSVGERIGAIMFWNGVALTVANYTSIREATKGFYGVT